MSHIRADEPLAENIEETTVRKPGDLEVQLHYWQKALKGHKEWVPTEALCPLSKHLWVSIDKFEA